MFENMPNRLFFTQSPGQAWVLDIPSLGGSHIDRTIGQDGGLSKPANMRPERYTAIDWGICIGNLNSGVLIAVKIFPGPKQEIGSRPGCPFICRL